MTFSAKVKEEILGNDGGKTMLGHLALLAGLAAFTMEITGQTLAFLTDGENVGKKVSFLCNRCFSVPQGDLRPAGKGRGGKCWSVVYEGAAAETILQGLSKNNRLSSDDFETDMTRFNDVESRRRYVMGAYLGGGYMLEPEKLYHLEFVSKRQRALDELGLILGTFGEMPKCVMRGNYHVMYCKSFESLDTLLNIIGAHRCMMELTNIKIEKEQKNEINRKNNFEVANMQKTVNASSDNIRDIETIMYTVGLDALPEELSEMALLRLANPEESLANLARLSGLSRSGVNHRLKKLSEIARELE